MRRPVLLDLYCCEGGTSTGYARAGFDVYGVDKEPQPNYPFPFHQGDALETLETLRDGGVLEFNYPDGHTELLCLADIDSIAASPPCQAHSTITPDKSKHLDLIPPTRALLVEIGLPFIMENVEGAKRALLNPVKLCGSSFGLRVRRHRMFESSHWLTSIPCDHAAQGQAIGVYGSHGDNSYTYLRPDGTGRGRRAANVAEAREVMGMPWASWHGATQAVPPAYTEFLGLQLLDHLEHASRAVRRSQDSGTT